MSTITATLDSQVRATTDARTYTPALAVAAFASLGAGAIHAVAAGAHSGQDQAVLTFTIVAIAQIGWGAMALGLTGRLWPLLGVAINGAAFGGWIAMMTGGISFIDGLEHDLEPARADTIAAVLAATAAVGALVSITFLRKAAPIFGRTALAITAVVTAIVATPAMVAAGSPNHHGGSSGAAAADHHADASGAGHEAATGAGHDAASGAGHEAAALPAKPYDPTKPIDLGGVEGVSLEEQARAENLIAISLARLPQFADYRTAEAAGFKSIGDGFTGDEHFINQAYMSDGKMLNPDYPESLVYKPSPDGTRTLTAAMFMAEPGITLETVPNVGGKLTQWHIHNNLCFTTGGLVRGLTNPDGSCNAPLVQGSQAPMIHVWIVPHECGPFAALEGVGAGQIRAGETKLCDHAHGG